MILVTGGAGYIGSHIVRELSDAGEEVVVLDDLSTGHRGAVAGVSFVEADVADRFQSLTPLIQRTRSQQCLRRLSPRMAQRGSRRVGTSHVPSPVIRVRRMTSSPKGRGS